MSCTIKESKRDVWLPSVQDVLEISSSIVGNVILEVKTKQRIREEVKEQQEWHQTHLQASKGEKRKIAEKITTNEMTFCLSFSLCPTTTTTTKT